MVSLPSVNRDLKRLVILRRVVQILFYLAWIAFWVFGALAYNAAHQTYRPERLVLGWKLVIWILTSVFIGFFLFRIPKLLRDRDFEGEILSYGTFHSYDSSADPGLTNRMNYSFRLNVLLRVRLPNGKIKRWRLEQKPGFYLYYREGNFVRHFSGLPYPIVDPSTVTPLPKAPVGGWRHNPEHLFVCIACGSFSHDLSAPCETCRHSLVDPKDAF